ncbi:AMP-binding enzyme family protein (macronuclear) [Tetrahymena thermophila SB210]|uniref:AMP-binding enzyme family protein n=1 Tax=Tetrahymena thermophila (strain SB210) TaxID=312017 RepID=Q22SF5_TETTS|nr:AMP-binding enzyme family protein [Tetrahymena thermophila SB210]EAR87817.2 AMP-binding enzyme family protein [Tetrahymena thermophila SB210]|eukprot:XP_001008062.2 AMP-binding enzyme family protein [Tetrahymena thermophila SB210]
MGILDFDLFSSKFQFKLGAQHYKKGTLQGIIFTVFSTVIVLSYFIYLMYLYFNNLIDPLFRSQSFIMNNRIDIPLTQNLLGFSLAYNSSISIEEYQALQNKTYVVYIVQFYYQDSTNKVYEQFNLNLTQCEDPSLRGYNCIDFSKISNYSIILDQQNNVESQLMINLYGCNDLDNKKTTVPDNCAPQSEIDSVINGLEATFQVKLKAQQFNTTSRQIQTNYRNTYLYGLSNQFILSTIKTQKQETKVNNGLLFQTQEVYSSPIQYDFYSQTFDRQISLNSGLGPYFQIQLVMDEIVQQFQIQYPTITQILALVNSVASMVVIFRVLGRNLSQKLIQEDFFMVVLRNLYQDKYQQIANQNNLLEKSYEISLESYSSKLEYTDEILEDQSIKSTKSIKIPNFKTKSRDFVEKCQINNYLDNSKYLFTKNNTLIADEQELNNNYCELNDLRSGKNLTVDKQKPQQLDRFIDQTKFNDNIYNLAFMKTPQTESIFQKNENQISNMSSKKKTIKNNSQKNIGKIRHYKIKSNGKTLRSTIDQKLKAINSIEIKKEIQNLLFKFQLCKSKKYFQTKCIDPKQIKKIYQQANTNLDIFVFYKDIIFLKKAISMLLRQDQLTAIQLISLTDNYLDIDFSSDQLQSNFRDIKSKLNYFEKHNAIFQSEQLQSYYIQKFLFKCQNEKNLSEIDLRILFSIIKNQQKF